MSKASSWWLELCYVFCTGFHCHLPSQPSLPSIRTSLVHSSLGASSWVSWEAFIGLVLTPYLPALRDRHPVCFLDVVSNPPSRPGVDGEGDLRLGRIFAGFQGAPGPLVRTLPLQAGGHGKQMVATSCRPTLNPKPKL